MTSSAYTAHHNSTAPKFLLFGCDEIPSLFSQREYTTSIDEPFDVAVLFRSDRASQLYHELAKRGKLLLPIVNATPEPIARADSELSSHTDAELQRIISELEPTIGKLRTLPELHQFADSASLTALALSYSRGLSLNAAWNANQPEMIDYPLLTGLNDQHLLLEELANLGLLRRRFFERIHRCSNCLSSRLNVREECVSCESSHLEEQTLLHHYQCGHQGLQKDFEQGRKLICPKCSHELRHYGVDYDKPSTIFECLDCSDTTPEPNVGFVCADCGQHSSAGLTKTVDYHEYELTSEGVIAVTSGNLPNRTMESAVQGVMGTYAKRDFINLIGFSKQVAERYKRPLSAFSLTIENLEQLNQTRGHLEILEILTFSAEIIAQALRSTDIVNAGRKSIAVLLPETEVDQVETVITRIKTNISDSLSDTLELTSEIYDIESVEQVIEKLS